MTTSKPIKSARLVALVALVCVSIYSECALSRGGPPGLPTKGTCGFLLAMSYPFAYLQGSDPGDGWGVDALGTINFQTNTISVNITLMDPAPLPSKQNPFSFTAPFTTSAGPIPNSFTIAFDFPDNGGAFTFNLIPVNGGKTILMQGFNPTAGSQDGSITGTCQM